jgi:hypothetical protein
MRTETITQNIYTLAELTGSAREKALANGYEFDESGGMI